jgi:hypothetical protein
MVADIAIVSLDGSHHQPVRDPTMHLSFFIREGCRAHSGRGQRNLSPRLRRLCC